MSCFKSSILAKYNILSKSSFSVDDDADDFYVYVEKYGESAVIHISKDGSRWEEEVIEDEHNIVKGLKGYMGYLKPNDILSWMRKDFDRADYYDYEENDNERPGGFQFS